MFYSCRFSPNKIYSVLLIFSVVMFLNNFYKYTTYSLTKHKMEIKEIKTLQILKWTYIYFLENMDNKFIECGDYRCYITNNKTELPHSDIVAFNPMLGNGKPI